MTATLWPCYAALRSALTRTHHLAFWAKHSKLTIEISGNFQIEAARHCNNPPLSAEQSNSMLINERGSESPQEEVAIISVAALVRISEWRWSQERQSVLITMKEHTLWSELSPPSLFVCSLWGNMQTQQRLVRPCLVSSQGLGYHYRLMNNINMQHLFFSSFQLFC